MLTHEPQLAAAIAVVTQLQRLLLHKKGDALPAVLIAADDTLLKSFAVTMHRDQDAVQAALDLPWTISSVEGQINRIKRIKRTMYGRASFDLLHARVHHAGSY